MATSRTDPNAARPFKREGDFMQQKRLAAGLSQAKLQAIIGASSRFYISVLESGKVDPRESSLFGKIAMACNFSPQELYDLINGESTGSHPTNPMFRKDDDVIALAQRTGKLAVGIYDQSDSRENTRNSMALDWMIIPSLRGQQQAVVGIRIRQKDHAPYLIPGDVALLDVNAEPQSGDQIAAWVDGVLEFGLYLGGGVVRTEGGRMLKVGKRDFAGVVVARQKVN